MLFFPTVDEDFQYFRSQGYSGSLNDMHYKAMGDLTHTGSLTDRIHQFLVSEYSSFYEAMRDLRNSSASFIALRYGVLTKQPAYSLDFINEYYRAAGVKSNLNPAVTHSRAGQATMVDSDGKIKWSPHNLLSYSEGFSNWSKTNCSVTSNATIAPDGTTTADKLLIPTTNNSYHYISQGITMGATAHTVSAFFKAGEITSASIFLSQSGNVGGSFNLSTGVATASGTGNTTNMVDVGNGWYHCSVTNDGSASVDGIKIFLGNNFGSFVGVIGQGIFVWGAHLYRSDLGGMVNNPATGDSYVRTAGRVIGSELVTNGDFDTDSDWTKQTGWTIGSGIASCDGTQNPSTARITQTLSSMVVGRTYRFSLNVTRTAGTHRLYGNGYQTSAATTTGVLTVDWVANSTSFQIGLHGDSSFVGSIDNVSVKELDVNPATARYLPRVGHHIYNGNAWVNEGVLHESEARTNLVTQSEFASGFYSERVTLTLNQAASPDTNINAASIVPSTANGEHFVQYILSPPSSGTYTQTVFVKANGYSKVALTPHHIGADQGATSTAEFDLTAGTSTQTGSSVPYISNLGNGWYRIGITYTTTGTVTSHRVRFYVLSDSYGYTWQANGADGIYVYGAQAELGATPSSYIPTSGSTVTRAAETLTVPAANLPWPTPVETTGTELVTNGDFATDTDWTKGTGWTISGGLASIDGSQSSTSDLEQSLPNLIAGRTYSVELTITSLSAGRITYLVLGGTTDNTDITSTGTYTVIMVAGSSNLKVVIGSRSDMIGSIDNISVKEINPLSVSIQMDGRMTYADEGIYSNVVGARWRQDSSNTLSVFDLSTNSTDTGRPFFTQENAGVYDAVSETGTGSYSPNINVPFNVASRHGSTFINGAVDGTALTANTTPVALPDLSTTDLQLGYDFMGTIGKFRVWSVVDNLKEYLCHSCNSAMDLPQCYTFATTWGVTFVQH